MLARELRTPHGGSGRRGGGRSRSLSGIDQLERGLALVDDRAHVGFEAEEEGEEKNPQSQSPTPNLPLRSAQDERDGGEVKGKGREERDLKADNVPAQIAQPQRGEIGQQRSRA